MEILGKVGIGSFEVDVLLKWDCEIIQLFRFSRDGIGLCTNYEILFA